MTTLYDDGIRKALQGVTTLEEVFRVAKRVEN
jgi:type II secretory ATPase GspE/PulE/Tfp pilus assembly ATPase PilB-like protein